MIITSSALALKLLACTLISPVPSHQSWPSPSAGCHPGKGIYCKVLHVRLGPAAHLHRCAQQRGRIAALHFQCHSPSHHLSSLATCGRFSLVQVMSHCNDRVALRSMLTDQSLWKLLQVHAGKRHPTCSWPSSGSAPACRCLAQRARSQPLWMLRYGRSHS